MSELIIKWNYLVEKNISRVNTLPIPDDLRPFTTEAIIDDITKIFNTLIKLKSKSFYTRKEIETIFILTIDDINALNDMLALFINYDEWSVVPLIIYYIIADTFADLIELMEDYELYEGAKNLLEYQTYWFDKMSVKIPNRTDVK